MMPAASAPFGIPGSPKVELPARGNEPVYTIPKDSTSKAGQQLRAIVDTPPPRVSLDEIMRRQAECGFDRGPCSPGRPLDGVIIQPKPRGMARLPEDVQKAIASTKRGAELGAQEAALREQMVESKEKAIAISDRLKQAKGEERSKIQVELVRERMKYEQIKQDLVKVQLDIEKYPIDFTEKKDTSTPTDRRPEAASKPAGTRDLPVPPPR